MGKASSSKKVARAAGTGGGRTAGGRVPWNYYGVIALIVVLGVVGTAWSRHARNTSIASNGNVPPTVGGTPWHEALAVDACGTFLPNIRTTRDPVGLTTNGDGVIQIHPFTKAAAGKNATLGKFASSIGFTVNSAQLQVPGGHIYHSGDTCTSGPFKGQKAQVFVTQFAFAGDTHGTLLRQDPGTVRLVDQALLTVAFVPSSAKGSIPPPPASVQAALKATAAAATPPVSTPPVTTPTTPTTAATSPTTAATSPTSPTTASSATSPTTAATPPTTTAPAG